MVVNCRFCCLQDSTTQTTNPVLVDALQQVIKSLLAKEEHDVKTFYAQNEEIEKLQKEVKELKFELQSLQNVKASLATVLSEEKQRCDEYKKKLQTAQEALVKLHSCNKKMSKNAAESLLFSRPATQSREEPYVILAPDTCQVEVSSGDNNATEIRSEPKSRNHVFTKPLAKRKCMEKQKSPHSFFKKPRNKCEDGQGHATSTRNDSDHDPDETWAPDQSDEELCIPASPILSGYSGSVKNSFFAKKFKKDTTHDGMAGDHTSDSPSLLKNVNTGGANYKGNLRNRTTLKEGTPSESSSRTSFQLHLSDNESDSSHEYNGLEDENDENFGSSYQLRPRSSLSPINVDSSSDEESRDLKEANDSLDELFEKTDIAVPNISDLDCTRLEVNVERLEVDGFDDQQQQQQPEDFNDFLNDEDDFKPKKKMAKKTSQSKICNDVDETMISEDCTTDHDENFGDSFDLAPKKNDKPSFKYQSVVRKRDERNKLDAQTCAQCEEYFSDLSPRKRAEKIRNVCRHRHVFAPPKSPEHFWEIGIPDTLECKRRGYIRDEEDFSEEELSRLRERRRRYRRRRSDDVEK